MLCGLRLIEGLCQGVIFPSTHTLLSKWAPVSERAQLATYCYSGSQFGTVVMLSTSGVLASSFMGWPSIFYISGLASGLWAILWLFFGSNSPADYKYISAEERDFIQSSLGHNEPDSENDEKKSRKTPWGEIFTSMPFYSLAIVHAAHNWGFWTLLTEMPTYMKGVLKFDIKKVNTHLEFTFEIGHLYKKKSIVFTIIALHKLHTDHLKYAVVSIFLHTHTHTMFRPSFDVHALRFTYIERFAISAALSCNVTSQLLL